MSEKNSQGARSQGPRSTSKTTKMIGLILAIVQFVVFVFILQPTEQLTQQALNCIATFLLFLICSLFGVVEMVVIGPICCVLLVLTKTYTLNEILATGFGSNTVWFIVFAFALTAAVNKTGVLKRFVFKLMTFSLRHGDHRLPHLCCLVLFSIQLFLQETQKLLFSHQ